MPLLFRRFWVFKEPLPPAWSVKTRHAPSRHSRDARDYGRTTTAMHEIEYISPIEYTPRPPPPLPQSIIFYFWPKKCYLCVSQQASPSKTNLGACTPMCTGYSRRYPVWARFWRPRAVGCGQKTFFFLCDYTAASPPGICGQQTGFRTLENRTKYR